MEDSLPNPSDNPEIRAKLVADDARLQGVIRDLAYLSIRRLWPDQSNAGPTLRHLITTLDWWRDLPSRLALQPQPTLVSEMVRWVLHALHGCTSPDQPLPDVPPLGNDIADSVNDILLLSVFVIVLFPSANGYRTGIALVEAPAGFMSSRIEALCPEPLREHLERLAGLRISVRDDPGASATIITIPLT